jgi:DNA-binding XRE family transcriptional regulator
MNRPITFQTIHDAAGKPVFVVVPYEEFVQRFEKAGDLVPDAVVKLVFDSSMPVAKAWRTHLGLTQTEVAQRMGISQSAYAQIEGGALTRKTTRQRVADALGIRVGQLEL